MIMKKNKIQKTILTFAAVGLLSVMVAGCGGAREERRESGGSSPEITINNGTQDGSRADGEGTAGGEVSAGEGIENQEMIVSELEIRFGDDGAPFIMELENNETAAAIAGHVGTANWRLPIYSYDDFDNWEVMQYYDIPDRYEIPSEPEAVTSEQSGEVYYSEPNRILLFYQDGEVSGDYTRIGTIENTEEFRAAVENNPVLEGWGNKIIQINSME